MGGKYCFKRAEDCDIKYGYLSDGKAEELKRNRKCSVWTLLRSVVAIGSIMGSS